ncbi:MAG: UPF0175 family protein [Leptolyngbyaceae cyanobacterium SM1_3_5]|nr:UPF0175 family protein [Leptolyngbyaceae cyanobacterium SM1_3_5]
MERKLLELWVIEAYRSGSIGGGKARELLGFSTRLELDAFFKAREVYLHYDIADIEQDQQTIRLSSLGQDQGRFVVPEDFDRPLPEEILAAFEGNEA